MSFGNRIIDSICFFVVVLVEFLSPPPTGPIAIVLCMSNVDWNMMISPCADPEIFSTGEEGSDEYLSLQGVGPVRGILFGNFVM